MSAKRFKRGVAAVMAIGGFGVASMISPSSVLADALPGTIPVTSLGTAYLQDFDTLVSSGVSNVLPPGWAFSENSDPDPTNLHKYSAGDGTSAVANTYSFGTAGSTDRALGELTNSSFKTRFGAYFHNLTGSTINQLAISYVGEQWRVGTIGQADRIDFQYNSGPDNIDGSLVPWTNVDTLDFAAPVTSPGNAALNGNATANRLLRSATIAGLNVAHGETFWVRWLSSDIPSNSDHGLAVDDLSVTALSDAPPVAPLPLAAAGGLLLAPLALPGRRRRAARREGRI